MKKGELSDVTDLPAAAKILYAGKRDLGGIRRKYRICGDMSDGVDLVLCDDDGEGLLWAYKATEKGIRYGVLGDENVFYSHKVLWRGTEPFWAEIAAPEFFAAADRPESDRIAALIHFAFCYAEHESRRIETRLCRDAAQASETLDGLLSGSVSVPFPAGSGLTQAQTALRLLKKKENEIFDADSSVLLALTLAKVYNIFIDILPRVPFAPDLGARAFALKEFFGIKRAPKAAASEYEIGRRYYLLKRSRGELLALWNKAEEVIAALTERYLDSLPSLGYGSGEGEKENAKFCAFMAPDVLYADTLLTFIRDSGAADGFI